VAEAKKLIFVQKGTRVTYSYFHLGGSGRDVNK